MGKRNALVSSACPSPALHQLVVPPVSSVMGRSPALLGAYKILQGWPRACTVMGSELNFEMSGDLWGMEQQEKMGADHVQL